MPKESKLDLEGYMLLCDYPDKRNLFVKNQLEDVIFMHGFNRMTNLKKFKLEQDVAALELMQTPRSTINEIIAPSDSYSIDDIIRDLDLIGWMECPVTSVKRFGTLNSDDSVPSACSATAAYKSDSAITTISFLKKKKNKKKKKRKMKENLDTEELDNHIIIHLKQKLDEKADKNQNKKKKENSQST